MLISNHKFLAFKIIRELKSNKILVAFLKITKFFGRKLPLAELINILLLYQEKQLSNEDVMNMSKFCDAFINDHHDSVQIMLTNNKTLIHPTIVILAWNLISDNKEWQKLYEELAVLYLNNSAILERFNNKQINAIFYVTIGTENITSSFFVNVIFVRFVFNNKYLVENFSSSYYECISFCKKEVFNTKTYTIDKSEANLLEVLYKVHPIFFITSYFF